MRVVMPIKAIPVGAFIYGKSKHGTTDIHAVWNVTLIRTYHNGGFGYTYQGSKVPDYVSEGTYSPDELMVVDLDTIGPQYTDKGEEICP
jgi:hypothetical protein